MGDLASHTFEDIWFGEAYERLRLQHLTNRHPPKCAQCQELMYTVAEPARFTGARRATKIYTDVFYERDASAVQKDPPDFLALPGHPGRSASSS